MKNEYSPDGMKEYWQALSKLTAAMPDQETRLRAVRSKMGRCRISLRTAVVQLVAEIEQIDRASLCPAKVSLVNVVLGREVAQ